MTDLQRQANNQRIYFAAIERTLRSLESRSEKRARLTKQQGRTRGRPKNGTATERGAMLVHVAFALMGLFLLTGVIVDHGIFLEARNQAQNVADAGAHAGAVARMFDDTSETPSTTSGAVYESIVNTTKQNSIWGQLQPDAAVSIDWSCSEGLPPEAGERCVHVQVFRDAAHGNPLPVTFMSMGGVDSQEVRASARAKLALGTHVRHMKPWVVPDRCADPPVCDVYVPPNEEDFTGYGKQDIGTIFTLELGAVPTKLPSFYRKLSLEGANPGEAGYLDMIFNPSDPDFGTTKNYRIGDPVTVLPGVGPTNRAADRVRDILALDPNASWNGSKIVGSCVPACGNISPRVVSVPLGDPRDLRSGRIDLTIVNIFGFFLLPPGPMNEIMGVLVSTEGIPDDPNLRIPPPVGASASFLNKVVLWR